MNKVLITGANGQLGRALNKLISSSYDWNICNTEVFEDESSNVKKMDIGNIDEVLSVVEEIMPNVIINCAAHTAVDLCETDRDNAYRINSEGPKNLAIASERVGATLVHISTDYVFDGTSKEPYTEDMETNPVSVYGETKLEGERFVKLWCNKYFIVRTAWLYGDGKNFVATMLNLADKNKEIRVVNDQFGSPTSTAELAKLIVYLLTTTEYGTYHATCEGDTSWYEFAKEIFRIAKKDVKVTPVPTSEYPTPAKRPAYSILENANLKKLGGFCMKEWKDALVDYLQ